MFEGLLDEVDVPASGAVVINGTDPILPSRFPVGEAAAHAIGACAAVASTIYADRTGETQSVSVDVARAAASLIGFLFQRLNGAPTLRSAEGDPLVAMYECNDGRWVHLHGAFPALGAGTRDVLGLSESSDASDVANAVARWEGQALEDALAERGMCGAVIRSTDEWDALPQSRYVRSLGRVSITKIGESEPIPAGDGDRPLAGIRALDLTRVLAAPTSARTLAEHGATVMLVNSPTLPNVPAFVLDTSHGKLSTALDLNDADDVSRLRALAADADVFAQGYRAGTLERRGFGAEELAALRPGIIYVTVNCYGDDGPWRTRPGWEQLAQSVTGIADAQGEPGKPQLIAAAACDYTTGYLAALGTLAALRRRSIEGGSYHVRASLCQTGQWFTDLGATCDPSAATGVGDVTSWMTRTTTPEGELDHLLPVAEMSLTPPRWDLPSAPVGTHPPVWTN